MIEGLIQAFSPTNILWIFIGTFLGMLGGTLPGISGVTMMAVVLPIMYKMPLDAMVLAVIGIYASAVYSGGTAGILYNIPGDAGGVPTTIEGYRLTLQGKTTEALAMSCTASLFGNTFGVIAMIGLLPAFVHIIALFGSAERGLFALWALMLVSVGILTREDTIKGLISMGIGLTMAMVGTQGNLATIRFAKSVPDLWDGFHVLWLVLGLFAIPQLLRLPQLKDILDKVRALSKGKTMESPKVFYGLGLSYIKKYLRQMVCGSIVGTIVGIIPGIGSMSAGWMAYSTARSFAREPELVGKGSIEAIACIESSNNAAMPGALIPMFSLGIPGSTVAALIMSAFMLAGFSPGPQMMRFNGDMVWTIVFGCFVCGLAFYVIAYPYRAMAGYLINLPIHWMVSLIGALAMLGIYLAKFSISGGNFALMITVGSIVCSIVGLPVVGVLLGMILGKLIEVDLIRAYQVGGFARFLDPGALALIALNIGTVCLGIYKSYFAKDSGDKSKQMKMVGQGDSDELVAGDDDVIKEAGRHAEGQDAFHSLMVCTIALSLGIGVIAASWSYPFLSSFWPRLVSSLLLLLPGIVLLVCVLPKKNKIWAYLKNRPRLTEKQCKNRRAAFALYFILVITFNMIPSIGFIEGCALFALCATMYLNPKRPIENIAAAAVIFALVAAMKYGFSFMLPQGVLGI